MRKAGNVRSALWSERITLLLLLSLLSHIIIIIILILDMRHPIGLQLFAKVLTESVRRICDLARLTGNLKQQSNKATSNKQSRDPAFEVSLNEEPDHRMLPAEAQAKPLGPQAIYLEKFFSPASIQSLSSSDIWSIGRTLHFQACTACSRAEMQHNNAGSSV